MRFLVSTLPSLLQLLDQFALRACSQGIDQESKRHAVWPGVEDKFCDFARGYRPLRIEAFHLFLDISGAKCVEVPPVRGPFDRKASDRRLRQTGLLARETDVAPKLVDPRAQCFAPIPIQT